MSAWNRVMASAALAAMAAAGSAASVAAQASVLDSKPAGGAPARKAAPVVLPAPTPRDNSRPVESMVPTAGARPALQVRVAAPGGSAAGEVGEGSRGGGVADAGITMLDFEALAVNDGLTHDIGRSFGEDGFTVKAAEQDAYGLKVAGAQHGFYPGSTALYNNTVGGTIYLYANDFTPFSLEFMEFANLGNNGPATVAVHGVKYDGTEAVRVCTTSKSENREETFYFTGFNDLYYVYWTQDAPFHQFDNIGVVRAPVVLDFEGLAVNDAWPHDQGNQVYEDGFYLDNSGEAWGMFTFGTQEPRYAGSTALWNNNIGGTVTLSQYGGGTFNVHSMDISNFDGNGPVTVTFTGHRPDGSTMVKSFKTSGPSNGFETFQFTGFNNIESLTWTQDAPYHQFDNIVLSRGQQTLDFIDLSLGDAQSHNWGRQYRADGFRVKTGPGDSGLYTFGGQEPRFPGSTALYNNTVGGATRIETSDGTLFQLLGMEIAPLNGAQKVTVKFKGHKSDGTEITRDFTTSGQALRLETVEFDGSWKGLKDVEWTQEAPFHQFDNVRMVRATTLVDFQKLEHVDNGYQYVGKVYAEQGFRLTKGANEAHDFATWGTKNGNYNGSTSIFNDTAGGMTRLSCVDGGDFDLLQMDLSTLSSGMGAATVKFVGTRTDGSQVSQSFIIADSLLTRQACRFRGFSNLTRVEWVQDWPYHQIDNIVAVESAPEVGCYPDCNGDGALDLFDFLCFTNDFNAAGAYSNCDGDGAHDLFDFLCYVNAFNAGCK